MKIFTKCQLYTSMTILLLSLVFSACSKNSDDDQMEPNPNPSGIPNATSSFTHEGQSYSVDGFGAASVIDTFFVVSSTDGALDTLYSESLVISIFELAEDNSVFEGITGIILNYTGPGTYQGFNPDESDQGGLYFFGYSDFQNTENGFGALYYYLDEEALEGSVTITKDNANRFEGDFDVKTNYADNTSEGASMHGSFSIEKQ